jgi:hypothetical protein
MPVVDKVSLNSCPAIFLVRAVLPARPWPIARMLLRNQGPRPSAATDFISREKSSRLLVVSILVVLLVFLVLVVLILVLLLFLVSLFISLLLLLLVLLLLVWLFLVSLFISFFVLIVLIYFLKFLSSPILVVSVS